MSSTIFKSGIGSQPSISMPLRKRVTTLEMDMTSMVDVTFLLLIFFMVTASFVVQSAFQAPASQDGSSIEVVEPSPIIEVRVTASGEFEVAYGSSEVQSFNNKHELRRELNDILTANSIALNAVLIPDLETEHQDVIEAVDVLAGLKIPFSIQVQS